MLDEILDWFIYDLLNFLFDLMFPTQSDLSKYDELECAKRDLELEEWDSRLDKSDWNETVLMSDEEREMCVNAGGVKFVIPNKQDE